MKIRTQLFAGLGLVVGIFAVVSWINVGKVSEQSPLLGEISTRAEHVAERNIHLLEVIKDLRLDVVQVQQFLSDVAATRAQDGLDDGFSKAEEHARRFRSDLARARSLAETMGEAELAAELDAVGRAFEPYYEKGVAMARTYVAEGPSKGNALMEGFDEAAEGLQEVMERLAGHTEELTDASLASLVRASTHVRELNADITRLLVVAGLVGVALAGAVGLILGLRLSRLFAALADDVAAVMDAGSTKALTLGEDRRDEFGPVARALVLFRASRSEMEAMRSEEERRAREAEDARRRSLLGMADTVEVETAHAVEAVAGEASRIAEMASSMAGSAVAVGENSQGVAAAADQALRNAQSVAGAAEELSAAIREIGTQASLSSQVVSKVVDAARQTSGTVGRLTEAMERIDGVAKLIGEIADQTNLLSLNATIEAARAGEAGKGFAVVAGEVKHLANQVGRSTEEISREVTELQSIGRQVAQAIGAIVDDIDEVSGIAGSIAAAVEEQDAATQEIVRNVVQTTQAAEEVAQRISSVAHEARSTGDSASRVRAVIEDMSHRIRDLRASLNQVVRTATPEVNRRRNPRVEINETARLHMEGRAVPATLADLSLCGSRLLDVPELRGQSGTLEFSQLDKAVPFRVIDQREGQLRIRFDDSAAESAGLTRLVVQRHRQGRAA